MSASQSPAHSMERILDQLSTAVLVFDTDYRLRYLNHAGEVMFAQSARHCVGRPVHELVVNAEVIVEQLAMAINTDQMIVLRGCRLQMPGGCELLVNCTTTPLVWADGSLGVMLEMRQVDHQRRIEQDEQLISQEHAVRELVRGLAHEVKNPLGGLRGAAQLLEREIGESPLREYTQIIIDQADRLQVLMDRMLGPNSVPQIRGVNIHEILERVRGLVQAECGDSLTVVQDYDPSLPEFQADPDMLEQAVLNIVRNAVQALECDGAITLRTRVKRSYNIGPHKHRLVARIDIIDNGPGIDEELRSRIFYPMVTGRSEGTGLGLSIAQSLIGRHQGLIECSSEPGETVFSILLPLVQQ